MSQLIEHNALLGALLYLISLSLFQLSIYLIRRLKGDHLPLHKAFKKPILAGDSKKGKAILNLFLGPVFIYIALAVSGEGLKNPLVTDYVAKFASGAIIFTFVASVAYLIAAFGLYRENQTLRDLLLYANKIIIAIGIFLFILNLLTGFTSMIEVIWTLIPGLQGYIKLKRQQK